MTRRRRSSVPRTTVAVALAALLSDRAMAQDEPTPEPSPQQGKKAFTLDLPEWNPDPEDLPPELRPLDVVRPVLPEDAAAEVAELEAKIEELEKSGLTAETREQQDAALDEAITHARRVVEVLFAGWTQRASRQFGTNSLPRAKRSSTCACFSGLTAMRGERSRRSTARMRSSSG
jgi:hypothetical protein